MPSSKRQGSRDACKGKPTKRPRTQSFEYEELPPGHIRILQVTSEPKIDGRRRLSAQLCFFSVEHLPHFIALSYAWAEEGAPTRTLPCNDWHISISDHVHTALENLSDFGAACSFAIWIDAICIDQGNNIEKSKQVLHMGSIYSRASQTVIWLGPNELVDLHLEQIEYLSHHLESLQELPSWSSGAELESPPFPQQGDEIWLAVGSMISSRWFQRLWIVQELCLAQHVDVLCGHCFLPWDSLNVLRRKAVTAGSSPEPSINMQALDICRRQSTGVDASMVITLLDNIRDQLVSKPIDKVYGSLFLLPEVLRRKIKVDYSQESEYWTTYAELAHILLLQPGGLSVLSAAPGRIRPVQLPSWCPNWNERSRWDPIPQASDRTNGCGGPLLPLRVPNVRLRNDPCHIATYGFRIDRIVCTISFERPDGYWEFRHTRAWNSWQQSCLQQLKERMEPSETHASILSTHLRNLRIGLWTQEEDEAGDRDSETIRADHWPAIYQCYDELVSSCSDHAVPPKTPQEEKPGLPRFIDVSGHSHSDRTYFFTERGRVGRGCSGDRAGDVLVALYTAPELFVLRYEEGSDVATLIGDAYLDGCTDLDTMPSKGRGPDEWFTLG